VYAGYILLQITTFSALIMLLVFKLGSSNGDHIMAIIGESWSQNMKART
jgi:hypothetical protein